VTTKHEGDINVQFMYISWYPSMTMLFRKASRSIVFWTLSFSISRLCVRYDFEHNNENDYYYHV